MEKLPRIGQNTWRDCQKRGFCRFNIDRHARKSPHMPRLCYDTPTVENTELMATYARTSPQLYSSIAASDKYLLRYASNTWNIQFPNCVFHPELHCIRIPIPFYIPGREDDSIIIDVPYEGLSSLGMLQHPNPASYTIDLECHCEVYFLAENIIVKLPTTCKLKTIYSQLPEDGLSFTIPYVNVSSDKIVQNLTKLSIFVNDTENSNLEDRRTYNIVLYPLQRYPPQPLSMGIFQGYSNLTPFQSLRLVSDAIEQGTGLSRDMAEYFSSQRCNTMTAISSSCSSVGSLNVGDGRDNTSMDLYKLSQSGYGDDDDFSYEQYDNFDSGSGLKLDTMGGGGSGMYVEIIGGFNSTSVKRGRRDSEDTLSDQPRQKRQLE